MQFPSTSKAARGVDCEQWRTETNRKLEFAAQAAVEWGLQHECQIKELEAKLANDLSNSRAIHSLLVDALGSLEGNRQRVDRALTTHIPHIFEELRESMESLVDLQDRLPQIRQQVRTIRDVYDSGRGKAKELVSELEWKHLSFQERCYRIVFTRSAPVSSLEIALFRLAFVLIFVLFAWHLAGVADGAYRAYRHRLVWGDKLIS